MCVAIYKPAGTSIDPEDLWNCWRDNPDGMGLAVATGTELLVFKQLTKFMEFRTLVAKYQQYGCLIHFRIATHGSVNIDNCHPFLVTENIALIHNGMLTGMTDELNQDRSDTRVFVEEYLTPIVESYPGIIENPAFLKMVTQISGSWNRLIFLMASGSYAIINEDDGEWVDNIWFSNTYWKYTNWKNSYTWSNTKEKHVLTSTDFMDIKEDSVLAAYEKGGARAAFDEADRLEQTQFESEAECALCNKGIEPGTDSYTITTDGVEEQICAFCVVDDPDIISEDDWNDTHCHLCSADIVEGGRICDRCETQDHLSTGKGSEQDSLLLRNSINERYSG